MLCSRLALSSATKSKVSKNIAQHFSIVIIIEGINAYTYVYKFSHAFWHCRRELYHKNLAVCATLRTRGVYVRLAWNQAQKNAPDWVKLSSIDEWVDDDIEISDGYHSVEVILINCDLNKNHKKGVDKHRTPGDREQPADEDHGLNDAGLNLV